MSSIYVHSFNHDKIIENYSNNKRYSTHYVVFAHIGIHCFDQGRLFTGSTSLDVVQFYEAIGFNRPFHKITDKNEINDVH